MKEFTKGEITIITPFSLIDNEIFEAKGRLVAKCWRRDVAEILLSILNSQPDLLEACERTLGAMACDELNNGRVFDDDLRKEVKIQAEVAIAKAKKEDRE